MKTDDFERWVRQRTTELRTNDDKAKEFNQFIHSQKQFCNNLPAAHPPEYALTVPVYVAGSRRR